MMRSIRKWELALGILATSILAQNNIEGVTNRIHNNHHPKVRLVAHAVSNIVTYVTTQRAYAGTVYKWVDDNGVVHYTDSLVDAESLEGRVVESYKTQETKKSDISHVEPTNQQTTDEAIQSETAQNQTKRIAELTPDELRQLIDKTCAYITAEYHGTESGRKRWELKQLAEKLHLTFDITKPYKTNMPGQFREAGILFVRTKEVLDSKLADRHTYTFGSILKEYTIDGKIPVTLYSSDGFVRSLRDSLDEAVSTLGQCISGMIFIDQSRVKERASQVYDYSKRIRKFRGPLRLACRDFLNYKKANHDLTKDQLIESFTQELIRVHVAHERAHVYDTSQNNPVDREVIASLAALRDVPTLSSLHAGLVYANQDVQKKIRELFRKYGYDPNDLYTNPVEEISKVAAKILRKEYAFYI
jgi:hypothetical protein